MGGLRICISKKLLMLPRWGPPWENHLPLPTSYHHSPTQVTRQVTTTWPWPSEEFHTGLHKSQASATGTQGCSCSQLLLTYLQRQAVKIPVGRASGLTLSCQQLLHLWGFLENHSRLQGGNATLKEPIRSKNNLLELHYSGAVILGHRVANCLSCLEQRCANLTVSVTVWRGIKKKKKNLKPREK